MIRLLILALVNLPSHPRVIFVFLGPELPTGIYFSALSEHPDGGLMLVGGMTKNGLTNSIFLLNFASKSKIFHIIKKCWIGPCIKYLYNILIF